MAEIVATDLSSSVEPVITKTVLTGADTLTYTASKRGLLILDNGTGGAVNITIDGQTAPASKTISGLGTLDLTGGYTTASIAAGSSVAIQLKSISYYLEGTVDVTGGAGVEAILLEY